MVNRNFKSLSSKSFIDFLALKDILEGLNLYD